MARLHPSQAVFQGGKALPRIPSVFEASLPAFFNTHVASLEQQDAPLSWLENYQQQAFQRFQETGLPNRKLEAWKYVDSAIFSKHPAIASNRVLESHVHEPFIATHTIEGLQRWVFVNGRLQQAFSNTPATTAPVLLTDWFSQQAFELPLQQQSSDYLFVTPPPVNEPVDPMVTLNSALFQQGVVLVVPEAQPEQDNTICRMPLHLLFVEAGSPDSMVTTTMRHRIHIGKNAAASLVFHFTSLGNHPTVSNHVFEMTLDAGASLQGVTIQEMSPQASVFTTLVVEQAEGSRFLHTQATLSGPLNRTVTDVSLLGEGAHCDLDGVSVLSGTARSHTRVLMRHQAPNCTSSQVFKGILDENGLSDFDGTIFVAQEAQKTDANQLCQNLLLSDEAKAYTRPQLRIDAHDVKCSHGAATGKLSEDELFYLESRGLHREIAECLLTFGFAETALKDIHLPPVRVYLEQRILKNLGLTQDPRFCYETCVSGVCPTPQFE